MSVVDRAEPASQGVLRLARLVFARRDLLAELVERDLHSTHAGHGLNRLWAYLHPLVVVGTYLLIFGFVLGVRIAQDAEFPGDFPSYILVGVVPWLVMQHVMVRAAGALVGQANVVKQVVFPIELLPISIVLAVFAAFGPAFALLIGWKAFMGGGLPLTALLAPVVLLLHGSFAIGIALALAAITPFMRDVREFVTVFSTIAMYFTPAVYLPQWVPKGVQPLLYANPFSYLTWVYQDTFFFGRIDHPFAWVVMAVLAAGTLLGGYTLFKKLKPFYGHVL